MVFKLVRTDAEEPCKIQLSLGTHLLGRGKFLDCDDKRVSRNHGELQVTSDSVVIKSLHANPCFYMKKGSDETQVLKQNCTVSLSNGDQFGLLPSLFWYELLHCPMIDIDRKSPEQTTAEVTNGVRDSQATIDEDSANTLLDRQETNNANPDETREENFNEPDSPSVLHTENVEDNHSIDAAAISPTNSETQDYDADNNVKISLKRSGSPQPEDGVGVKKIKNEPVEVKNEPVEVKNESQGPTPGPSGDQGPSTADSKATGSPPKPAPKRERCMYGGNCYRKNVEHRAQFSHPADADWGGGARGECPWGAACRRRDPRHWRDHDHPPGTNPPPPGNRPVANRTQRNRKQRKDSSEDSQDSEAEAQGPIVTGKRQRKQVVRPQYSESESENEDPFQTDGSDEWEPGSQLENTQSQGFTQYMD